MILFIPCKLQHPLCKIHNNRKKGVHTERGQEENRGYDATHLHAYFSRSKAFDLISNERFFQAVALCTWIKYQKA